LCRFRNSYRNKLRAKNEATRRIHQRDAVEVSIKFGPHRRVVEAERNPGFIDLKLLRMEHANTVPVAPNNVGQRWL